jgi:hypothetical protein
MMRRIINILLPIIGALVALFLIGAVINAATAKSVYFLILTAPILAAVILVARWLRRRHLHLQMADVILDTEELGFKLPAPVNNLEKEINEAVLRNRAIHRARRNARVSRRRNTDTIIRLVGYPRH